MTIVCLEANYLFLEAALRLVLMSFLSLDGVYQGPGAPDEDQSGGFDRGGWLVPFADARFEEIADEWTATATGFLFGRRTYEAFSSVWPTITDPTDSNAARLNGLPKFVVTGTEIDTSWGPVTVIGDDVEARLRSMKLREGGELQIHGSGTLGRSLLAMGLVDELRIVTAPVVVGQGHKLFGDTGISIGFELLSQDQTPSGLTITRFAYTGDAATGEYKRGETNVAS
jgi:dihydrofolate reductase